MQHYVVHYSVQEGTSYVQKKTKASTIMGVAEIVYALHQKDIVRLRWEKVTAEPPNAEERKALAAFLALAGVPNPSI